MLGVSPDASRDVKSFKPKSEMVGGMSTALCLLGHRMDVVGTWEGVVTNFGLLREAITGCEEQDASPGRMRS